MKKIKITLMVAMVGLFCGVTNVFADEYVCTSTVIQRSFDNVVVPSGASCRLVSSAVKGNIVVQANGSLETSRTRVNGSIQSEGYDSITIGNKSRISGNKILFDVVATLFYFPTFVFFTYFVGENNIILWHYECLKRLLKLNRRSIKHFFGFINSSIKATL